MGNLPGLLGLAPPQLGGEQGRHTGGGLERGLPIEDQGPGPAGQHIGEGVGHLVASGPHRLGPQVGQSRDQRLGERRILVAQGDHQTGLRAVAPSRCAQGRGSAVSPAWSRRKRAGARPYRPGASRRVREAGTVRSAELRTDDVHGVGGHPPVGGELAAGDGDQAVGRHDDGVPPGQIGGPGAAGVVDKGRRPAQDPVTSSAVRAAVVQAFTARSRYSMSSGVHWGSSSGPS